MRTWVQLGMVRPDWEIFLRDPLGLAKEETPVLRSYVEGFSEHVTRVAGTSLGTSQADVSGCDNPRDVYGGL